MTSSETRGRDKLRGKGPRLSVVLRRKPVVRPIDQSSYDQNGHFENEDIRWLQAGYRLGAFKELIREGLDEKEFLEAFLDLTQEADEIYIGLAPLERGRSEKRSGHQHVGVASVHANGHRANAHAIWMPWASPKNKLEVAARFFAVMRQEWNMIIPVRDEAKTFFRHLCRLGLMRHIGRCDRYFEDGETALMFQTLERKHG